jgi:hypothetical protein
VNQRSKAIPYPPESHPTSQNFGFRVLKGKPHKVKDIQEARDNPAIQRVLEVLNEDRSPFFSVGCEKSFNRRPTGYWAKGYIEFAANFKEFIVDARNYFPLFFHFNKGIASYVANHHIQYWWDLQPADFTAAKCAGFSCCVWITTGDFPSAELARDEWNAAVGQLSDYFPSVQITENNWTKIY